MKSLGQLKALCECFDSDEVLTDRDRDQHITSSAVLVSRKTKRMLKVFHDDLKEYFQPGGHISNGISSYRNAVKNLEELGITEFRFLGDIHHDLIPLDIDTHTIPGNDRHEEHLHHDFRYLFVCDEEFSVPNCNHEWASIPELIKENTFMHLVDKVQFLWSSEFYEKQFYNAIVENVVQKEDVTFIAVQHFLPGVEYFYRALDGIGKVGLAIPKPKSKVEEITSRMSDYYRVHDLDRDKILSDAKLKHICNESQKIIFIDIGGWFASEINELCRLYPDKVLGVVEDTENGVQKYEKISALRCPVVSVARSPLKINEDTLIGLSIVFSADSLLRQQNKLIKYLTCGIFGYGKVGKSIAQDLMAKSIKPIVYEKNPVRMVQAYNDGCNISERNDLLEKCDIIFGATGQKSIETKDLDKLKRGAYIFSVTSADDEFEFSDLDNAYKKEEISEHITRYYLFEKSFYLANKGNAVNFLHNAVVGDFIHLVKGEMLLALNPLLKGGLIAGIHELDIEERKKVAHVWLKSFHGLDI